MGFFDSKPFLQQYGYDVYYFPTIMDGPVFRWRRGHIEVNASRNGVGASVNGMIGDVPDFKRALESAMYVAGRLAENDRVDVLFFDAKPYTREQWLPRVES